MVVKNWNRFISLLFDSSERINFAKVVHFSGKQKQNGVLGFNLLTTSRRDDIPVEACTQHENDMFYEACSNNRKNTLNDNPSTEALIADGHDPLSLTRNDYKKVFLRRVS
jgi:hypothetical protein